MPSTYEIHVSVGSLETVCSWSPCTAALRETSSDGIEVEFWLEFPGIKRKVVFEASVRVLSAGDPTEEGPGPWQVQVLSSQWAGEPVDACAVAWDTFPPIGDPPNWLVTTDGPEGIASDVTYHYLAATLITVGEVDTSECIDGGLTEGGMPTACGAEMAQGAVYEWQNQFDEAILDAARASLVPARAIKGVISEESQFWPASNLERGEFGLGHLTELGADNTLLWNKAFYDSFCPATLGEEFCGRGYSHQSNYRRSFLRGALLARVNADCPDCPWGIDLDVAQAGIGVLAETLRAYCSQTGRMVSNVTREHPGEVSNYEEMWKLTLAAYASGPGCVAEALKAAAKKDDRISWSSVSTEFTTACQGAVDYVSHIAR
ncbi:MAG TPA: hypothetical protein VFI11_05460 [Anaerolineales bacterium]|nr:hypothetical protein [Anaerolineales bacterium]